MSVWNNYVINTSDVTFAYQTVINVSCKDDIQFSSGEDEEYIVTECMESGSWDPIVADCLGNIESSAILCYFVDSTFFNMHDVRDVS